MAPVSTSQRTYRYLRLTLAGTPVALLLAVALAVPDVGWLPTVSHYFYSPARTVFSAALVAASACLLALSGRGPQRALLDIAALLAPLVAIVPTPLRAGEVPGLAADCATDCIPAPFADDLDNALLTYLVVSALAVVIGIVLGVRGDVEPRATAPTIVVSVLVIAAVGLIWALAPAFFVGYVHVTAAVAFFAIIAVVAVAEVLWPSDEHPPGRGIRIGYWLIAAAMVVDLIGTFVLGVVLRLPVVLAGEVVALLLFLAFWLVQTAQKWGEASPSLRA